MDRTVTIQGIGSVSLRPDTVVLSMTLRSLDKDYDRSMQTAAGQIAQLRESLSAAGFAPEEFRTADFNVCAEYESVCDEKGFYRSVFTGYASIHELKLEFPLDTARLSSVLKAVSGCAADPELNIHFTVKDRGAVNESLLQSAAENAKAKAEILTRAAGVALGQLLSIDYHWDEASPISNTVYRMKKRSMDTASGADLSICPENIELNDSVSFVWSIA